MVFTVGASGEVEGIWISLWGIAEDQPPCMDARPRARSF